MAKCPSCEIETVAGDRWCSICHTNLIDPEVGRLASPGKRLVAHLLDTSAFGLPFVVLSSSLGVEWMIISGLLFYGVLIGDIVLFFRGSTVAKTLLGLRVIKETGTTAPFLIMFVRELIAKPLSGLVFLLGLLWILFDKENQGWHDKLLSTYVVDKTALPVARKD